MKSRVLLYAVVLVLVAAAAAGLWAFLRTHDEPASRTAGMRALQGEPRSGAYSSSVVLSIDASKPSPLTLAPSRAAAPDSLSLQFDRSKQLKPLYDRLAASPAMTADAKYVMYRILSACASRTDRKDDGDRQKNVETRRKALQDSIADSNPEKRRRLELYDELMARCVGLENLTTTGADLSRLLEEAARDGDLRAKVALVDEQLGKTMNTPGQEGKGLSITDEQLHTLQQAIASRDPDAIRMAGTALSNSFRDMAIEVGPNHDEINGHASFEAWLLVACEYGLECGEANRQVQMACVYNGQCQARTLLDLAFFYELSPANAQLADQYREIFRQAVERNDWSGMQFARRSHSSGSGWFFTVRP